MGRGMTYQLFCQTQIQLRLKLRSNIFPKAHFCLRTMFLGWGIGKHTPLLCSTSASLDQGQSQTIFSRSVLILRCYFWLKSCYFIGLVTSIYVDHVIWFKINTPITTTIIIDSLAKINITNNSLYRLSKSTKA